jgi:phosphoribosylamine-glycine ligase
MQVVEGLEVAASAFFNGTDWMRQDGKVAGFLNFEEKKEANGNTGETTGEMGTTFWGCTEENELFRAIICRPELAEKLKEIGFRGVFDINCIVTDDRDIVALEPTCRFGVPATSYEFCEALGNRAGELIDAVARGKATPIKIQEGWGMVIVVAAKPFPIESSDENSTSVGEKLWILKDGSPVLDFDAEQWKHIHLYNFCKDEADYKVATKTGYMLTVTGTGETIEEIRESLIEYIKDNLFLSGQKYRTDIGARVEEYEKELEDEAKSDDDTTR